ncbi:MAG: dihydroneopterin aldolase [Polyangiaceae bacterium]|nr:dihydroneopterin aldolase [Polyangiaceae bacterium]
MKASSTIELRGLELPLDLGTYGPGDLVPEAHLLDLTLTIDSSLVLVNSDAMAEVFDYDPLIAEIDRLARDGHYETQEFFMTRVVKACAQYREIEGLEITVSKRPVLGTSGNLGVHLRLDSDALAKAR